jgi:putative two-component system response regulator
VIFLTSTTDAAVEVRGFEMGVVDFITKPFSAPVLSNRIKSHLNIDELIRERTYQLQQKTEQLIKMKNGLVFVLADMVENRDEGTGGHIERTTLYLSILIQEMILRGIYADELTGLNFDSLVSSARLHDVGKITISDTILNKPGKLTDDEFNTMKTHADQGVRIIDQIAARTDNVEFLQNARFFASSHHERWDGKGYPNGLAKTEIPIQGRLMAIVDVYDALISERPYKKAFSHDHAIEIIKEGAGTQFDPMIAEVFADVSDKIQAIKA